jgi:hypothetical protein
MTGARVPLEQFRHDGSAPGDDPGPTPMTGPLIHPARPDAPEPDPEADEIAALKARLEADCLRLEGLLDAVARQRSRVDAETARDAAARVAALGEEVLGSVIRAGFAAEIAASVAGLARHAAPGACTLAVAQGEHDLTAELVARAAPGRPVEITPDPALAPGQARMAWSGGGADFDAGDLARRLAPLLRERLADLAQRSPE